MGLQLFSRLFSICYYYNSKNILHVVLSTEGHESHDPCLNVFLEEVGIMTFVTHCTKVVVMKDVDPPPAGVTEKGLFCG